MAFLAAPLFTTALTGTVTLGGALAAGSTLMSVVGGMSQASEMRSAAKSNARNAERAAAAEQAQLNYQAGQETASGQHAAVAARRKAALMMSRAQAVAAASGGGALDESIMGGILEEGEREAGYKLYESGERASGLRYRGEVGVATTQNQNRANIKSANSQANATLLSTFANAGKSLASFAPGAAPGADEPFYIRGPRGSGD
jgi:hypothetical protein